MELLLGFPEYGLKLNASLPLFTSLSAYCFVIFRLIGDFCSCCHQLLMALDEETRDMKILVKSCTMLRTTQG